MTNNKINRTQSKNEQLFIGREYEQALLKQIADQKEAAIIIVHGRRRVGKTSIIEKVFSNRNIIKIEGLEQGGLEEQLRQSVGQLAEQLPGHSISLWRPRSFSELFTLLWPIIKQGTWTLFLEEYQWLSCYESKLTAELKISWDNKFRHNPNLLLILCGSSPSFMISKVINSKALHNRSQHELAVKPLPFNDAKKMLDPKCTLTEAFDAYLLVGGIPEYLKRLNLESSCFLSFAKQAFAENGFFINEFRRMLVSSLAKNPFYEKILRALGEVSFLDRTQLLRLSSAGDGGSTTQMLEDLALCSFIRSYVPIDKKYNSKLIRYTLSDPFLRTYFKQISPLLNSIKQGLYNKYPERAVAFSTLRSHLGYAFQEYCQQNVLRIAEILQFAGIQFKAGSYFARKINKEFPGFQVDLVFQRTDKVHTLCEIKYTRQPVGVEIIDNYERVVATYEKYFPGVRIHRVLISAGGADEALKRELVFDRIIDLKDLVG